MYDSRAKRPKLKPTDRRPTLDVTAASVDELTDDSYAKPPQTIDEMRRRRNQRTQNAQQALKPYIGKRRAIVMQDEDLNEVRAAAVAELPAASTTSNCNVSTSDSSASCDTTDTDVQPVKCRSRSSNVKASKCQDTETARAADTNCLQKEKLVQYLHAVG